MGNSDSKEAGGEDASTVAGHQSTDVSAQTKDDSSPDRGKSRRNRGRNNNGSSPRVHVVSSGDENEGDGGGGGSTKITDDQIQVNLAMADLMAYLQVVANNSNHLPVSRRDDPEVEKVISTLTTEEYAKKSAAFVPADIRVIGGTFTRYGQVWDLPTSEEYNACDGALEPGRSYGGACCNTLLKVVYDAANDTAAQAQAVSEAIFDEDEDDEEESAFMGRSIKSGFSLEYGTLAASTITWANLLKQMKAEFKEIGYTQVPKLTTSRKIDLNKPFSLVAEDSIPYKGKKRSLLIGCNYANMGDAELKASHDDIRSMKDYIVNVHNFTENPEMMTVLLDDGEHKPPTFLNIIDAFKALSEQSQPGDAVFVQFSGHGGRVLDPAADDENESYDEVIVPADYEISGLIRDTLIFKTLLAPMRFGVTVTLMIDCCDNGMVMELPYACGIKPDRKDSFSSKLSPNVDFSFVRFLKVVKTLYETSTFTQLGKTVGSALGPLALSPVNTSSREGDEKALEIDDKLHNARDDSSNFFDALVEACSPVRSRSHRSTEEAKSFEARVEVEDEKKMDELAPKPETLFERVINCTLVGTHEDDECSDDDTFKSRTYDEHSYDTGSYTDHESYEEHSFDDYPRRSRSSRHRRRRSNRRR